MEQIQIKNLRVIPERVLRNRSFIQYVRKFSEKNKTFCPLIRTRTCAYQGVGNVSFSENFTYLLNERFQMENAGSQYGSFFLVREIKNSVA